jgi:putative FmdB family regulatory protein
MPTYDYQCDSCGHKFELFQSINDPVVRKCPECKKLKLRRLFGTGAALFFTGSGFYQPDYRSDAYKTAALADSNKSDGKSNDSAGKSDSKPSSGSGGGDSGKKPSKKTAD